MNNLKGFAPSGFTLVEVMISVLILGVGLTLVANSYIVALRGVNSTANNIGALRLGREKLDELELLSLKDGLSASVTQDILKSPAKSYDYKQEIIEITQPKDLAKFLVQACLSLSWQEQNATKNVTFSTYLPRQKQ
ncbi:MAG: prepilin-type N-terminal cleavage/methylation domain-containing protein [Candidatus Omnitrophica bacterium]|nr:prepilin-type N-terminal cleavage/methylation domain-containing protein [Candidatus Omnitrophota bacterium]